MTITLTREEAQQVLDALDGHSVYKVEAAIKFLRARLSAPEPEPAKLLLIPALMEQAGWVRKREWQGLTENEKEFLWDEAVEGREHFCSQYGNFADALEAKLKEKNA
jgi:hypothetical protein